MADSANTSSKNTNIGLLGIGDMGSGIAKNLIKNGYCVTGFDPDPIRAKALTDMGGIASNSPADIGETCKTVFLMVMRASQALSALFGKNGLCETLASGSTIIVTATFNPSEVIDIAAKLDTKGISLIDTPVSGGFPGAQNGTLTMMVATNDELFNTHRPMLEAISATIHRVGNKAGDGQLMKACLQSLLGSIFSATFEATVMAAKAGLNAESVLKVFSTSSGGSPLMKGAIEKIISGDFENGGSSITTMHKDLVISTNVARDLGVPLFTASMAMQLFQAGITKYPMADNWVVTKVLEDICGAELRREGAAK